MSTVAYPSRVAMPSKPAKPDAHSQPRSAKDRPFKRSKNYQLLLEACPDLPHPDLVTLPGSILKGECWPDHPTRAGELIPLEMWAEALERLTLEEWVAELRRVFPRGPERRADQKQEVGDHYEEPLALSQPLEQPVVVEIERPDGTKKLFRFRPSHPTNTRPGTPEREAVLAERARRGLAMFHPCDRRDYLSGRGDG